MHSYAILSIVFHFCLLISLTESVTQQKLEWSLHKAYLMVARAVISASIAV